MMMAELKRIEIRSLYGMEAKQGIVEIEVGEETIQMDVRKAREVAAMLLSAIEAAVSDQMFVEFFQQRLKLTNAEDLARMLSDFRVLRQGLPGSFSVM